MNGQTYQLAIEDLYKAYRYFANRFWKDTAVEIPEPVILITSRGRKSVYGWHWKNQWVSGEGEEQTLATEIVIAAETFNRGARAVLETLLHEMAHHWNSHFNIPDCTKTQYHNGAFKKAAMALGLEVVKMKGKGWALTNLGEEGNAAIDSFNPNEELYKFHRVVQPKGLSQGAKYITVNLKRADFEGIIERLMEDKGFESPVEVIKHLLNNA